LRATALPCGVSNVQKANTAPAAASAPPSAISSRFRLTRDIIEGLGSAAMAGSPVRCPETCFETGGQAGPFLFTQPDFRLQQPDRPRAFRLYKWRKMTRGSAVAWRHVS